MSTFNRFCAKAKRTAVQVGGKVGEMSDNAAQAVRIKRVKIRMDEQYEKLGVLTYREIKGGEDLTDAKQEIVAAIEQLEAELATLVQEKKTAKAKKQ